MPMQLDRAEMNCSLCGYEISNPTCAGCLKRQVIGFIGDKTNLVQDVEENMDLFENFADNKAECVLCKEPVSVCSYCFYREIYKAMKRTNPRLARTFGRLFQCSGEMQMYLNHYFSLNLVLSGGVKKGTL